MKTNSSPLETAAGDKFLPGQKASGEAMMLQLGALIKKVVTATVQNQHLLQSENGQQMVQVSCLSSRVNTCKLHSLLPHFCQNCNSVALSCDN